MTGGILLVLEIEIHVCSNCNGLLFFKTIIKDEVLEISQHWTQASLCVLP